MRKSYSNQLRLESVPIEQVTLNLESRDSIVPVLRALQHIYCSREVCGRIMGMVASDIACTKPNRTAFGTPTRSALPWAIHCTRITCGPPAETAAGCSRTCAAPHDRAQSSIRIAARAAGRTSTGRQTKLRYSANTDLLTAAL